ncbi:hypothetical protein [Amycolatopsis sp.]|uniref:hypothetical protein n=1 Tax=Amycolatopsis sp. TaxID=37632 RepID=UPI002C9A349E|nr:hypothetical protein [Amycolatopsis sp.]HVV10148.1 hypothetical protein [Amycolatopsis sp.]
MTTLLIYAGPGDAAGDGTRTGGLPLVPSGFTWPHCGSCDAPLQFTAQVRVGPVIAVFHCRHESRAFRFAADRLSGPAAAPGAVLSDVSAVRFVEAPGNYAQARDAWPRRRDVLGQLGGSPVWLRGEQIPDCPACGTAMAFVAQLEVDGGCAYVFTCRPCAEAACCYQC